MAEASTNGGVVAADAPPVLALREISAGYGRTTVLREIDLTVSKGSISALLGPNGAGKTTLLRVASGLLRPSFGSVRMGEEDVTGSRAHDRARAGLCLIPEGRGIFRSLTVKENLALQIPPWANGADIDPALEAFPVLKDRLSQVAGTLSGGEQQMVAVARCYLASPSLVLVDEVSVGLAPRIVDEIFESLTRLARAGVTLLLVEQYVNRILELADTVNMLDRGRIVYSGPAADLDEESLVRNYLGTS